MKKTPKKKETPTPLTRDFAGQPLQPFSFLRQSALVSISTEMGATYSSEVAIAVWLMLRPDAEVKAARRNPSAFVDAIDQFCEQHGLGVIGPGYPEANALFKAISQEVKESRFRPALPENDQANEEDEAGN